MLYRILIFTNFLLLLSCANKKKLAETSKENLPSPSIENPAEIAGKWRVKVITPVGIHYPEMTLVQNGHLAEGELSGNPVNISIYGDSLSFSSFRKTPLGKFNFDYTGHLVQKDSMEGKYKMRGGPFANKIYDWGARKLNEQ